MTEPHVLVVTSAGSSPSAVVPVLAALEAGGMRVRAIDVGGAGAAGSGVADRVRRVLLGEGAERRLRRELETSPPDVAIAFDPHAALALTVARDQATQPAPVLGIVGELEPSAAWGQTDCDRYGALDAEAAVALAEAGADGDRILIIGPLGPRAFADAGAEARDAVRSRFGLGGRVVVVDVGGLGPEVTAQLALQLSLSPGAETTTFLFDAAGDADAAAVLRRQVPTLGLKAKLFGATPEAPLLWRAGDVVVTRPRPESLARAMLIGARVVALLDDGAPALARVATALEGRQRAVLARSTLLVSTSLDAALKLPVPAVSGDGADAVADIAWVIAGERRAVIEERRSAARAATTDKVRSATQAAAAAARTTAMPGALEDLGGGPGDGPAPAAEAAVPDAAELEALRVEVKTRIGQLERSMNEARQAAERATDEARQARERGDEPAATTADRKAEVERGRMHGLLAEMAGLEAELRQLDAAATAARQAQPRPSAKAPPRAPAGATPGVAPPSSRAPASSVDDLLADLKRRGGAAAGGASPGPASGSASGSSSGPASGSSPGPARPSGTRTKDKPRGDDIEDELAALKRKMTETKGKP